MTAVPRHRSIDKTTSILGDVSARSLLPVQALHSAGEALFALSLVGSLFFNVSVDAARPRILLYLALTMAPFAILAPLIGPVIDRLKGGHRVVLLISIGGRALVAALLASQLKTLLLYPEAFVIVVLAKAYVVARNALVPSLVEDRDHLVVVNSQLARVGALSGVTAASVGVGVLQLGGADWVLRVAAVCYALAALGALRIPPHPVEQNASPIVEATEMHGPGVNSATIGMAALRAATGFVLFHVGFALKTSGEPAWVIGLVAGGAAFGGFLGTFIAPRLRGRMDEQRMLTLSVMLPAVVAVVAALRFHPTSAGALALALGIGGSVGRRAFDGVVQTEAPHARRGQAYAGLETRLEIAWVVGSLVAVLARASNWIGMVILASALGALGVNRAIDDRRRARVSEQSTTLTLPLRLLETAEAVAARGDRQQAVLVAVAAVEAASWSGAVSCDLLVELQTRATAAAAANDVEDELALLRLAHQLVTETTL